MIPIKEKYIIDDNGNRTSVILSKKDYDRLVVGFPCFGFLISFVLII